FPSLNAVNVIESLTKSNNKLRKDHTHVYKIAPAIAVCPTYTREDQSRSGTRTGTSGENIGLGRADRTRDGYPREKDSWAVWHTATLPGVIGSSGAHGLKKYHLPGCRRSDTALRASEVSLRIDGYGLAVGSCDYL